MAEDINMDSFIRDTLRSYERIRDKSFDPIQQTIVSKQSFSTNLSSPRTESADVSPIATGSIVSGGGNHPFKITVKSGEAPTYKVFLRSSIINGINGGPFNITGLNEDKEITEEKFIVAEATVTSNPFEVTNDGFTINAVGADDTNEVLLEDGKQTKLRLLIGKITVEPLLDEEGTEIGKALKAWQAVTTSFRTAVSFFNGAPVYILQVAPTHQSRI
jgi:hypothetical protein